MSTESQLLNKGRREPLKGVLSQARYHVKLAEDHQAELAAKNWKPEDTARLVSEIAALDTARNHQVDEREGARGSTRAQAAAVGDTKSFIRKFKKVVPLVFDDHGEQLKDVDRASFNTKDGRVGQHPTSISGYLNDIQGPLKKLDPHLAPYFDGKNASELALAHKAALDEAGAAQDLDEASLPEDTREVYLQKGKVLRLVERLNAIGHVAFDGRAETIGKFNKDLLTAARRERKKDDEKKTG